MGEMDANLVGSAGFEIEFNKRIPLWLKVLAGRGKFVPLANGADGNRGFAQFIVPNNLFFSRALSLGLVGTERVINHLMIRLHPAVDERHIAFIDLAVLELRADFPVGLVGLGKHNAP